MSLIELFRARVGDSLEVLDAIREALTGQDKERIIELVNGYIDRARADLQSLPSASASIKTAKQQFDEHMAGENMSALERLRFFCSLAMKGQDWLDVEPFFDDLSHLQAKATPPEGTKK